VPRSARLAKILENIWVYIPHEVSKNRILSHHPYGPPNDVHNESRRVNSLNLLKTSQSSLQSNSTVTVPSLQAMPCVPQGGSNPAVNWTMLNKGELHGGDLALKR